MYFVSYDDHIPQARKLGKAFLGPFQFRSFFTVHENRATG